MRLGGITRSCLDVCDYQFRPNYLRQSRISVVFDSLGGVLYGSVRYISLKRLQNDDCDVI